MPGRRQIDPPVHPGLLKMRSGSFKPRSLAAAVCVAVIPANRVSLSHGTNIIDAHAEYMGRSVDESGTKSQVRRSNLALLGVFDKSSSSNNILSVDHSSGIFRSLECQSGRVISNDSGSFGAFA